MCEGNRKDIRNAVEAAHAAQGGWGKRAAHNRAQIVYYLAENLEIRRDEVAAKISAMTGGTIEDGAREVDESIRRLFHWAACVIPRTTVCSALCLCSTRNYVALCISLPPLVNTLTPTSVR